MATAVALIFGKACGYKYTGTPGLSPHDTRLQLTRANYIPKKVIATTRGTQAPTVLAGILRSFAVRKIANTSNELGIEPNDLR